MSWKDNDMDGAMVGSAFLVHADAIPYSHTAIRQDDPDLAVYQALDRAQLRVRDIQGDLRSAVWPLESITDPEKVATAALLCIAVLSQSTARLIPALQAVDNRLAEWAEVVDRLGFKDGKGRPLPLPGKLASLLAVKQASDEASEQAGQRASQ